MNIVLLLLVGVVQKILQSVAQGLADEPVGHDLSGRGIR